jgi:SMC interacting uncharacterized protein involved in chromosome segregation
MKHIKKFNESNSESQEMLNEYSDKILDWSIKYEEDIDNMSEILSDLNTILEDFKNEDIDLDSEYNITLGNSIGIKLISDYINNPNMINDIIETLDKLKG